VTQIIEAHEKLEKIQQQIAERKKLLEETKELAQKEKEMAQEKPPAAEIKSPSSPSTPLPLSDEPKDPKMASLRGSRYQKIKANPGLVLFFSSWFSLN